MKITPPSFSMVLEEGGGVFSRNWNDYPPNKCCVLIDGGKSPLMSGGEHAWDLVTQHDQAIASGLYLFSVEDKNSNSPSYGTLKEGKFLIIK